MKSFSLLCLLTSTFVFGNVHSSCAFFKKNSTHLFKVTKSNSSSVLNFNVKLDSNCNLVSQNPIGVYIKDSKGICSIPRFTYIRKVLGFKNYTNMISKILSKRNNIEIPNLKKLVKSKDARHINLNISREVTGCRVNTSLKYKRSSLRFNNIYQYIDYISVSSVQLLLSN